MRYAQRRLEKQLVGERENRPLAPIPSASVTTMVTDKAGASRSRRTA